MFHVIWGHRGYGLRLRLNFLCFAFQRPPQTTIVGQ